MIIPVSAIIPTKNRTIVLKKTLLSIAKQEMQPAEIIIIDASETDETVQMLRSPLDGIDGKIVLEKAIKAGAAAQRNQAFKLSSKHYILFMDDDIELECSCLENLWKTIQGDISIAGCNAIITNQQYLKPGRISALFFWFMNGKKEKSYAGKCMGPVINLLPEDKAENPNIQSVEWLNLTCTLYKKESLPTPLLDDHFQGYSLREDVALSLKVAKHGKLVNVRTAKIFHDSQSGEEKNNIRIISEMDLVNRYYIMRYILYRNSFSDGLKLFIQQMFGAITSKGIMHLDFWKGKLSAIKKIRHFK